MPIMGYLNEIENILSKCPENTPNNIKPGSTVPNFDLMILDSFGADKFAIKQSKKKEQEVHYVFNQEIYDELMKESERESKLKTKRDSKENKNNNNRSLKKKKIP